MTNQLTDNNISLDNFELETSDSTPFLSNQLSTEQEVIKEDILSKPKGRATGRYLEGIRVNIYIWGAAILATTGGVLFGYDLGIISGAILQLRQEFCLGIVKSEVDTVFSNFAFLISGVALLQKVVRLIKHVNHELD